MTSCNCDNWDCLDCFRQLGSLSAIPTVDSVMNLARKTGEIEANLAKLQANLPYCENDRCYNKHYSNNRFGLCNECFERLN